jgi:AcrR family transcriptional regulator
VGDELDTRGRILATTLRLFLDRGYERTTLRDIAAELGISKAAVLYHFPAKADLTATLIEPFLAELEALLQQTATLPRDRVRWAVVEGLFEVYVRHRTLLRLVTRDAAPFLQDASFRRLIGVFTRAGELLAGPEPRARDRVRAAQVVAMLTDPVLQLDDLPVHELRAEVLAGVARLLGPAGLRPPAGPLVVRAGRPPALTPEQVVAARRMRAEADRPVAEIAEVLGVSRATVYRYLSADGLPATAFRQL